MSSENKTPNLQLNQWEGNEYPKRTDFIEDNKKIDEAYKELKDSIKDGGKVSSVNGKIGDVILKAEDIKTNLGVTVESQMAKITKQVESIEVTAEKTTLDSDKFTSKNVKAGMEELFTFADNGKKNIATVIGSPLSISDTFDNMKGKIQTLKNTFASNLTAKGQSSSGTETLNNLINKVESVKTSLHPYNDSLTLLEQAGIRNGVIKGDEFIKFVPGNPEVEVIEKQTYRKGTNTLLSTTTISRHSSGFESITAYENNRLGLVLRYKYAAVMDFSGTILITCTSNSARASHIHHNGDYILSEQSREENRYDYTIDVHKSDGTFTTRVYSDYFYSNSAPLIVNFDINNYYLYHFSKIYMINSSGYWSKKLVADVNSADSEWQLKNLFSYFVGMEIALTKSKFIN